MPKVYIVGNYAGCEYERMFISEGWSIVDNIDDADLVQFTGGSDVSPSLYGEPVHPKTWSEPARDEREEAIFVDALTKHVPMAGICRGGQFLHVMSGGKLWQHITGHAIAGTHKAISERREVLEVTSTHHQAMREGQGEVILRAMSHGLHECMDVDGMKRYHLVTSSVEAVYHEETECLCFQPHPEMNKGIACRRFYFGKIFECFGLGKAQ